MVCIIDDREDMWNSAPNLIRVKPYQFFKGVGDINAPPTTLGESNQLPPEPPPEELEDPPNEIASEARVQVESATEEKNGNKVLDKEDTSKPLVEGQEDCDTGNGKDMLKESVRKTFVESTEENEEKDKTGKKLLSDVAEECDNVSAKLLNGDESEEKSEEVAETLQEKKVSNCTKCVNDAERGDERSRVITNEVVKTDEETVNTQSIEGPQGESAGLEQEAEEERVDQDKQLMKGDEKTADLVKQPIKDNERTVDLDKQLMKDDEKLISLEKQPIKDGFREEEKDCGPAGKALFLCIIACQVCIAIGCENCLLKDFLPSG